jgi:hypothetical protein
MKAERRRKAFLRLNPSSFTLPPLLIEEFLGPLAEHRQGGVVGVLRDELRVPFHRIEHRGDFVRLRLHFLDGQIELVQRVNRSGAGELAAADPPNLQRALALEGVKAACGDSRWCLIRFAIQSPSLDQRANVV